MFWAKVGSSVSAVAKPSVAPGARSWTISSIADPSSPEPAWPGSTSTVGGRSPLASRVVRESTPSDSAHTFTPVPSTPKKPRASSAPCVLSPSEVLIFSFSAVTAWRTLRTSGIPAMASRSSRCTRARTRR
jgi:hypothetical protein